MSSEITAWVVTVRFHEETLTEINELSNHLTRAGFTLVLNDDEGNVHELGTIPSACFPCRMPMKLKR